MSEAQLSASQSAARKLKVLDLGLWHSRPWYGIGGGWDRATKLTGLGIGALRLGLVAFEV